MTSCTYNTVRNYLDEIVAAADKGVFKECTVDKAPLRDYHTYIFILFASIILIFDELNLVFFYLARFSE